MPFRGNSENSSTGTTVLVMRDALKQFSFTREGVVIHAIKQWWHRHPRRCVPGATGVAGAAAARKLKFGTVP